MIGFAKVMGDIADGAGVVVMFAVTTLLLTLLAVRVYCQSWRVAFVPVLCSCIAVIWQLGALVLLRYGHRPHWPAGAIPDIRDRRQPRRAEDQRRERCAFADSTAWRRRAAHSASCWRRR